MKERPILMSAPMVRAILVGEKSQTRRVVKKWPDLDPADIPAIVRSHCPYGVEGDRLWVKETFKENIPPSGWIHRATDETTIGSRDKRPWRPSIFMPRIASRILLEVVSVRVERVQEISTDDAKAEGATYTPEGFWKFSPLIAHEGVVEAYAMLWDSINGPGSWEENPWVWVVEFKRVNVPGAERRGTEGRRA